MEATSENQPGEMPFPDVFNAMVDHFLPQVSNKAGDFHAEMLSSRIIAVCHGYPSAIRDANLEPDPSKPKFRAFLETLGKTSLMSTSEEAHPVGRPRKRFRPLSDGATLGPLQPSASGSTWESPSEEEQEMESSPRQLSHSTILPAGASDAMDLDA